MNSFTRAGFWGLHLAGMLFALLIPNLVRAQGPESIAILQSKLTAGFKLLQGEVSKQSAEIVHRAYQPKSGTWDALIIARDKPISLGDHLWLTFKVNVDTSGPLQGRTLRRVALRVLENGKPAYRNYEISESRYYLDGKPLSGKQNGLKFDADLNSWQLVELDLRSGDSISAEDLIDQIAIQMNHPLDLRVRDMSVMTIPAQQKIPMDSVVQRRTEPHDRWEWIGQNNYRIMVECPACPTSNSLCPAWAEVDIEKYTGQGVLPSIEWNPDSVRVVAYDRATGKAANQATQGQVQYYLPSKAQRWKLLPTEPTTATKRMPERISWLQPKSKDATVYGIYFDYPGSGETELQASPAFIGTGDTLTHGNIQSTSTMQGTALPVDWNGDGVKDIVSEIGTVPQAGLYVFINEGTERDPHFARMRRIRNALAPNTLYSMKDINGDGLRDLGVQGGYYSDFDHRRFSGFRPVTEPRKFTFKRMMPESRSDRTFWYYADWDGDGKTDLLIGTDGWWDYGWANGFNAQGEWQRGPLDGRVYWYRNIGTNGQFDLDYPIRLKDNTGKFLWTYGYCHPIVEDFDQDGDLDLLSTDFIDNVCFYENVGTRSQPALASSKPIMTTAGPFISEKQALVPTVMDWDNDGDLDILVRAEDESLGYLENLFNERHQLIFKPIVYWTCKSDELVAAQLVAQDLADWTGDGVPDLVFGHSPGTMGIFRNVGRNGHWSFGPLEWFCAGDKRLRIEAGPNGSIQGPAERRWGYTVPAIMDFDLDGLPDLISNSIWGRIVWFRNPGPIGTTRLEAARPIEVAWPGAPPKPAWNWWDPKPGEWATEWRSKVVPIDYNKDGLMDLVTIDYDGYLVLHERKRIDGKLILGPGERIFKDSSNAPWQINSQPEGGSGRLKFCLADWDADGDLDLIQSEKNSNVGFYENVGSNANPRFMGRGAMVDLRLTGHDCVPSTLDYDGDGRQDLIIGAEDGHFYCFLRSYLDHKDAMQGKPLAAPRKDQ
jgi:hypothetical protein